MKVIFCAGPFRAIDGGGPWEQEQNVRVMESLALHINSLGAVALCPHAMTRFYQDALPDTFWIKMTRELMRRCDAVVLGPNWMDSSGTRDELGEAETRDMPIFKFCDDTDWNNVIMIMENF